jgi:NAD(P)-dependent dehydrogenase (short-subunit alcohol dehydrogenase family)
MNLKGKAAIVTGAGRGIGRATALLLAELGAGVVVNDIGGATDGTGRDGGVANAVASEIQARGGQAIANTDSVSDWAASGRLVEQALARFGHVDILVNCAGTVLTGPIWEVDPDHFKDVVAAHIFGTFNCVRRVAPLMIEKKYGRIVNFVSRGGLVGVAGSSAYGMGKGGIFGFTNCIARELLPHGVLVNSVNPAAARTRMVTEGIDRAIAKGLGTEQAKRMLATMQEPEDVAPITAFLCSEEIDFAGQVFFPQNGAVSVLQPLDFREKLRKKGRWTPDELLDSVARLEIPPLKDIY